MTKFELENIVSLLKLWAEVEKVDVINFKMYSHDRGGVYVKNMYKVFSDNRNYSLHIVFTVPLNIKEGEYKIKELISLIEGK